MVSNQISEKKILFILSLCTDELELYTYEMVVI